MFVFGLGNKGRRKYYLKTDVGEVKLTVGTAEISFLQAFP
jgi:hypothetical protein